MSRTTPSVYRRIFWPVLAPSLLLGVAGGATVPVQILAALELGASPALAALIVAVAGGISLLTTVPAGRLIDRAGDRQAMLLATSVTTLLVGLTIAALVHGGPGSLAVFMTAAFLRSPAMNVWGLARQAYTAQNVAPHEVGRAMTALGGTMRIGNLVGPLLGGVLMVWLPLSSAYALAVVCSVLAVALLYTRRGELPRDAAASPREVLGGGGEEPPSSFDWTRVVLAGIAITTLAVARVGQPVIVQLWGAAMGLSSSTISLLVALGAAVEIILMFPGGALKDRLGRVVILVTCLVIYGSGFLLIVPSSHRWGLVGFAFAVVVMAIGNGLGAGVNMTIGADLSPAQGRGRFLGVWALFSNAGQLGGPLVISALASRASVATAPTAVGALALVGAAWTLLAARRMHLP